MTSITRQGALALALSVLSAAASAQGGYQGPAPAGGSAFEGAYNYTVNPPQGYPQGQGAQYAPPPQYGPPAGAYPNPPGNYYPAPYQQPGQAYQGPPVYQFQGPPACQVQGQYPPPLQGRVVEAPAGLVIPINLQTSISTQVAKAGDYIQGTVNQQVFLQNGSIPSGAVVSGCVSDAAAGRMFDRTGTLSITFNQLRLPDGSTVPIAGHLVGDIGKYAIGENGQVKGEGWGTKLGGIGLRTAVGAGGGAALGTAMGAICGGGIGTGAWAGTAIGGGLGLAEALVLRKGRNVIIPSGTAMQLQLDQPLNIPGPATAGIAPAGMRM